MITLFEQPLCEDETCLRHRALAGKDQTAIVKMLVSCALTLALGGRMWDFGLGRKAESHPPAPVFLNLRSRPMPAFVADAPTRGSEDPVTMRVPSSYAPTSWRLATWSLELHQSGRVTVSGNYGDMLREFWPAISWCWFSGTQTRKLIVRNDANTATLVEIRSTGEVLLGPEGDPASERVWRDLVASMPTCGGGR